MRFGLAPDSPMDMNFPMVSFVQFAEGKPGQGLNVVDALRLMRHLIRDRIVEPLRSYL
jgi:hypothetical protein